MRWIPVVVVTGVVFMGCGEPPAPTVEPDAGTTPALVQAPEPVFETVEVELPEPEPDPLAAGQSVSIPAGLFRIGSAPGTPHRKPRDEADLIEIELGAFRIDRLPYPNDPARAAQTNVTLREAEQLCEARDQRLCSELEWERACKGSEDERLFATGASFDPAECSDPSACASPENVLAMGTERGEWTSSAANRGLDPQTFVFRGAAPDPEQLDRHRCSARRGALPATRSANLGFRCCAGPEQEASYPTERDPSRFRVLNVELEQVRTVLRSVPELARFADSFRPFDQEAMARAVTRGDGLEALRGWELTGGVLRWSPTAGESAWVVAGQSGEHSVLAVLYEMPNDVYRHASSFVLQNEAVPIAIAFTPPSRNELLWSSCWGCLGEGGAIVLREDNTLAVVHR